MIKLPSSQRKICLYSCLAKKIWYNEYDEE